jgi:hypothetical protein
VDSLRSLDSTGIRWGADEVERVWAELVTASEAARPEQVEDDLDDDLELWLPKVVEMVSNSLPVSGYQGWAEARRLGHQLADAKASSQSLAEGRTLADVLNGAWLARFNAPTVTAVDQIEERARAVCHEIIPGSN